MSQEISSKPEPAHKPYPEADSTSEQAGKVAEGLSTAYTVQTQSQWNAPSRTIAGLAADDEVWSFVKVNDLLPHLETAIQLAKVAFINVHEVKLSYEPDPELPNFNSVAIHVKAAGTPEELFTQYKKYVSQFVDAVPTECRHQISMLVGVV